MFPGQRSTAELAFLSAKYMSHFVGVFSEEEFQVAVRLVEETVTYFPTPKHILDVKDAAHRMMERKAISRQTLALPEETDTLTPEEIAQNQEKMQVITDMLTGKMTMDEAVARQEKMTVWAQQ